MTSSSPREQNITIFTCTFVECEAEQGGALYLQCAQTTRHVYIYKCLFKSNKAKNRGGALYFSVANYLLSYCKFDDNHGKEGGSIYCQTLSTSRVPLSLLDNLFIQRTNINTKSFFYIEWTNYTFMQFNNNQFFIDTQINNYFYIFQNKIDVNQTIFRNLSEFESNCVYPNMDVITKDDFMNAFFTESSFTVCLIDETETIQISSEIQESISPSLTNIRNSPSLSNIQNSPSLTNTQNSPSLTNTQNSPSLINTQNSPSLTNIDPSFISSFDDSKSSSELIYKNNKSDNKKDKKNLIKIIQFF